MVSIISWIASIILVVAIVINVKKNPISFILYAVSDVLWIYVDLTTKAYPRCALDLILLGMAIWGYFVWKKQ